ncbi:MAG TPA: YciI family protein [Jatrophihabitantaceae bacterium]
MTEQTWFVLLHTPGPAIEPGQNVFDHPGIGEHFAFLHRMADAGRLVAAGPFGDASGEGMTVLRADDVEHADRLAREDDQAVVSGVLDVRVRPWQVVMSAVPGA